MKNSQSKFKPPRVKKKLRNKATNKWIPNLKLYSLNLKNKIKRFLEIFVSEFEKGSLRNVISKVCKNRNAKKESFKRLSELIGMSAKWEVQKGVYRIYPIDSTILTKVLPIDNLPSFHFFFHLSIIAVMETTAAISCKLIFLNDKKYFDKNYFKLTWSCKHRI